MLLVFFSHLGAFKYLQLMELDRGQWELGYDVRCVEHHGFALTRKAKDEMGSTGDAVLSCETDGVFRSGEVVASVDALESLVIHAFHTVFQHDVMGSLNLVQVAEQGLVDAVGSGADDDAGDLRRCQGLSVYLFEFPQWFIGVGIGLEIGEVMLRFSVAFFVEFHAFFNLLSDALLGCAIGGVEGLVAAKGAASLADLTIAVGAAETCVDADFLHTAAELLHEVVAVGVETSTVEDGLCHEGKDTKNSGITW